MKKCIVFVHTVAPLIEVFNRLADELLPGVSRSHILDEPLLARVIARGGSAPEDAERLREHVHAAEAIGAQAVLVTCSSLSPSVDQLPIDLPIPVFKIDEAMVRQAVGLGSRIGVIATNASTLQPTQRLLEAAADRMGHAIVTSLQLVEDALPALLVGDGERHDRLVIAATRKMAASHEVVVLAQASMARVLRAVDPADFPAPVLSSPHLALSDIGVRLFGMDN